MHMENFLSQVKFIVVFFSIPSFLLFIPIIIIIMTLFPHHKLFFLQRQKERNKTLYLLIILSQKEMAWGGHHIH